jgi:hypothetical protein
MAKSSFATLNQTEHDLETPEESRFQRVGITRSPNRLTGTLARIPGVFPNSNGIALKIMNREPTGLCELIELTLTVSPKKG